MNQSLTATTEQKLPERYQRLLQEARAQSARLAVLTEISQAVTAALELDEILDIVVEQTKWVLDYDRCSIAVRNKDGATYHKRWLYTPREREAGSQDTAPSTEAENSPLSAGLAGWVIRRARVLRVHDDEKTLPDDLELDEGASVAGTIGSVLGLPLTADGETLGALIFESRQPATYSDADVRLGTILSAQIAVAIRNAQLLEEGRRRTAYIEALNAISRAISGSLKIEEVFQTFAVQTKRLIEHDRMSIALLDEQGDRLHVHAVTPDDDVTLHGGTELPVEGSAVGRAVTNGTPVIQSDTKTRQFMEDEALLQYGIRSYVNVPLFVKGETIGTLNVGCRRPDAFGPRDVETLSDIAGQVAMTVQNQQLYTETQRFAERLEQRVKERTRELEEVQAQLIEAERFAAAGRLAAAIAHEINNPMQSIRSGLELLARRVPDDGVAQEYIAILLEEQGRVSGIIRHMLDFYRPSQAGRDPTDVNHIIRRVLHLVEMDRHETQIETDLDPQVSVTRANADQLKQVFLNLTLNAIEAMEKQGHLTITTRDTGDEVIVTFTDEGPGITVEERDHIFEPFYSTKAEGLGIGLSVSRSLIESHGGDINVRSSEGDGATFEIRLPASQEEDHG